MRHPETNAERRARRVRARLSRYNKAGLPRLSVHRTNNQIYAQIIDDTRGITLAAASSLDGDLRAKGGANVSAATAVGNLIAERAKAAKVSKVMFDRGSFLFHGRIKALAEAARAGGLEF
jgi:large subunit ribosomal protein L18